MELSLTRNKNTASGSNAMDALTYKYKDGTNQLDHVIDAAGDVAGAADIGSQSSGNYLYNSIGQLTDNIDEGIKYVYNTAGLVTSVTKDGTTQLSIQYNDRGQRLSKTSPSGTTHYVRDAAGSVLGIYFNQSLTEQPVYGNSRLGVRYRGSGKTAYQLSDHLGNVRAVVMENEGNAISITNKTDYYPFGMPMPNRQTTDGDYRYAYQGQEKDKETGKEAFELRLWDSRIGRWLTTDPAGQYASPYLGMGNNPISRVDPDGGEDWVYDKETKSYFWDENVTSAAHITDTSRFEYVGIGRSDIDSHFAANNNWFVNFFSEPEIDWNSFDSYLNDKINQSIKTALDNYTADGVNPQVSLNIRGLVENKNIGTNKRHIGFTLNLNLDGENYKQKHNATLILRPQKNQNVISAIYFNIQEFNGQLAGYEYPYEITFLGGIGRNEGIIHIDTSENIYYGASNYATKMHYQNGN
mgnify:CR=1 FL=1